MNIYQRMFRMDLEMFKTRIELNTQYEGFYKHWEDFKITTKKEWEAFEKIKDNFIKNAWDIEALDKDKD